MKHLVNIDSKLCDIVVEEPTVITVLSRFGIMLGVGDKTVATICAEHGLDSQFFTAIINTYLHEDYFPQRILASHDARLIINYLRHTNAYYEQYLIPNVERHLHLLIAKSAATSNLELMLQFFMEVKRELLARIAADNDTLFPEVLAMQREATASPDAAIDNTAPATDSIEDKLDDLIHMFVMHLSGDYDQNLGLAVIFALFSLHKDIVQNNRIRHRILHPLAAALKSQQL